MKKWFTVFFAALFLLLPTSSAFAADWQTIYEDWKIDQESIQMAKDNPSIYRAWFQDENADKEVTPNDSLPFDFALSLYEFNLDNNTSCVREEKFFKKDGTLVEESQFTREESGWDYIGKDTIGEEMVNKLRELVVTYKSQIEARPRY